MTDYGNPKRSVADSTAVASSHRVRAADPLTTPALLSHHTPDRRERRETD